MSDDEKRKIKMAALLEYEEAREHLALLRVKGEHLARLAQMVDYLLVRGRRDSGHLEAAGREARELFLKHRAEIAEMITADAVLAFDDEMLAAVDRFKSAEKAKKALGYSS